MLCQLGASLSRCRGATVRKRAAALVRQWRAVNRLGPRQCRGELTDAARSERVAPAGGDAGQRAEDGRPLGHGGLRDGPRVVAPCPARTNKDIETAAHTDPALAAPAA